MNKFSAALFGLALLVTVGCQRGTESTVTGDRGEELTVAVPPTVEIAQGATKPFSITVNRKKIKDTARVKIEGLPEGVTLVDEDIKFADGSNNQFVKLKATASAPPQKEVPVTATATAGKVTAAATFMLTVQESLENKAASKKAFAEAMNARLNKVKAMLDDSQTQIKTIYKDENNRATHLKRIAEHMEELGHARSEYEDMLNTPVEVWERAKDTVANAVASIEESTRNLVAEFKAAK